MPNTFKPWQVLAQKQNLYNNTFHYCKMGRQKVAGALPSAQQVLN